jgi:hypothetical protein
MSANPADHLLEILKDNSPGPGKPIGQLRADFEKFYLEFRFDQPRKIRMVKLLFCQHLFCQIRTVGTQL